MINALIFRLPSKPFTESMEIDITTNIRALIILTYFVLLSWLKYYNLSKMNIFGLPFNQ